jgi:hypothetical protein
MCSEQNNSIVIIMKMLSGPREEIVSLLGRDLCGCEGIDDDNLCTK